MNLNDVFIQYNYVDILRNNIFEDVICLDDIFDQDKKPEELLNIYVSPKKDELFFIIDGQSKDITTLCEDWDDKVRIFTLINSGSEAIKKLKYNIVQLVICSTDFEDRNKGIEGDLSITRKIILKGKISDNNIIDIDEDALIEIPFYDVSIDDEPLDKKKKKHLRDLLPEDKDLQLFMEKEHPRERKKDITSFEEEDFNKIRMWMEK